MADLAVAQSTDIATRIEDYLADQIQTAADLTSIDTLLAKVREQQKLLKIQLATARKTLSEAEHNAGHQEQNLRKRTAAFQHQQLEIDTRITTLTETQTSDDAVKIFESRIDRLQRLETASGYVEILQEVDKLVKDAHNADTQPRTALEKYTRLRQILSGLQGAQRNADEAAPHLVDRVEKQAQELYQRLRQQLEKDFQKTLERLQWPKKELNLLGNIVQTWQEQVVLFLELQEAEIKTIPTHSTSSPEPVILLPLGAMVRPLTLRFQYHFYGDRPTNRLDKPQYFFSHTLDLIEEFSPFMTEFLQPVLDERTQQFEELESYYADAISSFITALLPMVTAKCLSVLPQIANQPQLLSHFIRELLTFDNALRDSWAYAPFPGLFTDWRGLTWEILSTHAYFDTWLEVEKTFALSRYKKIRDAPDSNQLDYDTVEPSRTKPTKSALRVNDLLETVTDRYRSLVSFSQKLKFFLEIQLSIFDDYHVYLHGALQAYLVTSHTAGRWVQGTGQSQDDAMGIKGLESLVKIFGSAEYLERKMSDWSEDVFFLELWDELQDRAQRNATTDNASIGQDLALDQVALKTSSSINPNPNREIDPDTDGDGGALFDEISKSYCSLREQAEREILRALETLARNAIKPYARLDTWSSLSQPNPASQDISQLSPSSSLDTLLSTLTTLLTFLSKTLSMAPLRRLIRPLSTTIAKELTTTLITKHTFSTSGAMQLRRDTQAIQQSIDEAINIPQESKRGMKKLDQILVLLNLPIKSSPHPDKDDWGFDDDNLDGGGDGNTDNNTNDLDDEQEDTANEWGLWQAEKAIFASNESARSALVAMGLDEISEIEARTFISRRVELKS